VFHSPKILQLAFLAATFPFSCLSSDNGRCPQNLVILDSYSHQSHPKFFEGFLTLYHVSIFHEKLDPLYLLRPLVRLGLPPASEISLASSTET
jgi:hypothetical protein